MRFSIPRTFRLGLLAVASLLVFSSCDSGAIGGGTQRITLTTELNTLRFRFNADDLRTGRLEDVDCGCSLDIAGFLESRGYSKADIVSAQVQSAQLVMLFPITARANILNKAILKLDAEGVSSTEVADESTFTAQREAPLTVLQGRNIASIVERTSFDATLQIDANTLEPGVNYEMGVVLTLVIDVEGVLANSNA
ncbi:MAG: hypothetical protein RhofKO_03820 [Rhodothermales bacterium]